MGLFSILRVTQDSTYKGCTCVYANFLFLLNVFQLLFFFLFCRFLYLAGHIRPSVCDVVVWYLNECTYSQTFLTVFKIFEA